MSKSNFTPHCLVVCANPSIDIFAAIDNFRAGESNRIQRQQRFPGGKGIHVAMALAEIGIPTVLLGFWGNNNGAWIKDTCSSYYPSLTIDGVEVDGMNRSCYTFKSDSEWNETELLGTGLDINHFDIRQLQLKVDRYLEEAKSMAICGSWPSGANGTENKELIINAKARGIPSFIDCTGAQLVGALQATPFCIHLNRSEAERQTSLPIDQAFTVLSDQTEFLALTDGARGLYLGHKQQCYHSKAIVKEVISAVGSGDCLVAGLMAAHYIGESAAKMAKWGAACGAANCIRAELGMLYKADLSKLFDTSSLEIYDAAESSHWMS